MRKKILVEFTLPDGWEEVTRGDFKWLASFLENFEMQKSVEFLESAKIVTPCDSTENVRDTIP